MIKVTALIPINYNNGSPIPQCDIDGCLSGLLAICGGYTAEGAAEGRYTMDSGAIACDKCHKVFVVCEDDKLSELREWASGMALLLDQESVYFEYHQTNVEFIRG